MAGIISGEQFKRVPDLPPGSFLQMNAADTAFRNNGLHTGVLKSFKKRFSHRPGKLIAQKSIFQPEGAGHSTAGARLYQLNLRSTLFEEIDGVAARPQGALVAWDVKTIRPSLQRFLFACPDIIFKQFNQFKKFMGVLRNRNGIRMIVHQPGIRDFQAVGGCGLG